MKCFVILVSLISEFGVGIDNSNCLLVRFGVVKELGGRKNEYDLWK